MEINPERIKIYRLLEATENWLCRANDELNQARRQGVASREIDQLEVLIRDCLLTVAKVLRELLPEDIIAIRTRNLGRS